MIGALVVVVVTAGCSSPDAKPTYQTYGPHLEIGRMPSGEVPPVAGPAPGLAGPNIQYTIKAREIAQRSTLFSETIDRRFEARAREGHDLVVVLLDVAKPAVHSQDGTEAKITMGDRTLKLPRASVAVAASVPAGVPLTLTVTDDGRSQTMDLTTGTPGPDAVPEMLNRPVQKLSGGFTAKGAVSAFGMTRQLTETYTFMAADRRMYLPNLRWAPPGRAWLMVDIQVQSNAWDIGPNAYAVYLEIDAEKTCTLTLPDGTRVRAMKGGFDNQVLFSGDGTGSFGAIFDVPAGTRAGTFSFSLGTIIGSMKAGDEERTVRYTPRPSSATVAVNLPG